ncbi:hypothetical protein L2E82_45696 [Cichorium intybus]|uniref:Uncharacterized protein n=1 Tax=Cichorium intybus TaxID=13427 RepID=A0ACB8ZTT0_CICIN|nr:hypothetical protein L2E82_45696 [Cichorium intybus]
MMVSEFVFEEQDFLRPWEGQNDNLERYALQWESEHLIDVSTAIQHWLISRITLELMKQGAMTTVLNSLLVALALPATLLTLTDIIDSKWSIAMVSKEASEIWEELEEQQLNGLSLYDKYRDNLRSVVEFKMGLLAWEESLAASVENFELAGASPTGLAVIIKNHCSNGASSEGFRFKIDEIVQLWNEMYDVKRWQTGVPSFRLELLHTADLSVKFFSYIHAKGSMEESAQRRERLKAMRMEASQEGPTSNEGGEHSAVSLSNPLLEPANNSMGQVQPLGQSFNYYTNPMAAYSGNKQTTKVSPQISHDYSSIPPRPQTNDTFPSPSFQPQINHSPNPRMQPPHGQYQNPNYSYTPNPPQVQGGYPTAGGYPGPGSVSFPSPGPHFRPGPGGYPSPSPGPGGYPSPGRGYPNPGRYPSSGPHFRASPNHGSGPGLGYPNQGRGQWTSGSSSGRGRGGRWSGQGGGRGGGANNHVTAEERPDLFYNKSMVEDPWKFLEPVIWKSQMKPKPWLLYSSNTKKPRVSEPSSGSQQSLAEILAASFNEAASGEADTGL